MSFHFNGTQRERRTITDLKRRSMEATNSNGGSAEVEVVGNTGAAAMEVWPKGTCLSRYKTRVIAYYMRLYYYQLS